MTKPASGAFVEFSTDEWKAFFGRLKGAERKIAAGVRKQLRDAAKPLGERVATEGAAAMPSRGGLAAYLAGSAKPRVAVTGAGISLVLQDRGGYGVSLRALNSGELRHPVFGLRSTWVGQVVPSGSWTDAFDAAADDLREDLADIIADAVLED